LLCGALLTACASQSTASLPSSVAPAQRASTGYRSIYSFGEIGKPNDGREPVANLVAVGSALYGTTLSGGTTNAQCALGCGTVFRVSPAGTEAVIYRFKGGTDGAAPSAGLIVVDGVLYGTTSDGGAVAGCSKGCGTVFKLKTNGESEHVLYRFAGGKDGAHPVAGLLALSGTLYGTTEFGGTRTGLCSQGCGTIFALSASGTESVLYRFKGGKDGANPLAELLWQGGSLYGTTQYGGASTDFCATGCGTIFRASTSGSTSILYRFGYSPSSADGAYPAAALVAAGSELYGTTFGGGENGDGTVFETNASSGAESVLHSFDCCSSEKDGAHPLARLTQVRGTFYGTTRDGGSADQGTVFEVTVSGSESVAHSFAGKPDGAAPQARLTLTGGALFGTTSAGGKTSSGSIFELTP
jgi:uncharacterized repeat protein (TIGR03803 family)